MKKFIWALALCFACATTAQADLIISGVVDGTQTGGIPKAIELVATDNIADLSIYSIVRDTNGAGPFDSSVALPAVALSVGDFFYVAGAAASATILDGFGFTTGLTDGIANVNGDDILGIGLTSDPLNTVSDSFGLVAQGDTDFYANSFAIRNNSSQTGDAAGSVDAAANFTVTAYTDADLQGPNGFGTFVVNAVPEPTTAVLFGLAGLGLCVVRRRS